MFKNQLPHARFCAGHGDIVVNKGEMGGPSPTAHPLLAPTSFWNHRQPSHTFPSITLEGMPCGLVGEVINSFEQKAFHLVARKFLQASEGGTLGAALAGLRDGPFFPCLEK